MLLVALKSASFRDNGVKSVKTSNSTTNRLEDDIRNGEGIVNMQSTFFLSPSPHEIGLSDGKEEKISTGKRKNNAISAYSLNSNSNARRKLEVHCTSRVQLAGTEVEHATAENSANFSESVDRRDTYFPLQLYKPPGETIEMAIERSPRFFSPRETRYASHCDE
ncbi:hypothetical protein ALC53_00894 [Atta colombica]|uniref:Uncharacterized protein n=1 Tax=Atta colombica TaxID=520822 RepID=A0A195BUZ0_9HYME|nr:hypothetical protein ALC53_00894 [Atta colombica]